MNIDHKIILVMRPTRLAELVLRFNTVSQAQFYIERQGADFADYLREDRAYHEALAGTQNALSRLGRVQTIDRSFLPNFVFAPDDTVVVLGQDGLVANTLKYLDGQPLVGVNPDPARWDGQLLPFAVRDLPGVMPEVLTRRRPTKTVTMAQATLNNGQTLLAVNDIFVGPKTHTSARYSIRCGEACETQSSSGVVISTGMGSTGWLKSLLTGAAAVARSAQAHQPSAANLHASKSWLEEPVDISTEFAWDANYLCFTVREPFPTKTTGATIVHGQVTSETPLQLESRMAEHGVIFSDGIENDFLEFNSGTQAVIGLADRRGQLVR
jgi:NAD kinase